MICPVCHADLDDDSKFCEVCGSRINSSEIPEAEKTEGSAAPGSESVIPGGTGADDKTLADTRDLLPSGEESGRPEKNRNLPVKAIGLTVGTFFMIVGVIRIAMAGTSVSSTSFGADFYTYTYQGIVAVSEILASIEVTLGWILVAIGAAIDFLSLQV